MGTAIAGILGACQAILLGRTTFELFAPAWSARTAEDDPGAPFMNGSPRSRGVIRSSCVTALAHAGWRRGQGSEGTADQNHLSSRATSFA